jgi:transposase
MAAVDRNNPKRGTASESTYSMMEFMRDFPDDAACLDYLWRTRFAEDGAHTHCPKCDKTRKFHRVKDRPSYDCDTCGHHIHPTAGTIFHKSPTSLHLWFYAMYVMASTRCGISAKQLERELGVTYKTAWRMFNLIRNELMKQDDPEQLSGKVEMDETFVGGKPRESYRREVARRGWNMQTAYWDRKAIVFGAVERKGRIRAEVVTDSRARTLEGKVREFVMPESIIFTDDFHAYHRFGKPDSGYTHHRINHSARIYVQGDVHTQTIEGFFGLFKNGVRGVYHNVSQKWLQGYVNEYVWRYNRRDNGRSMFHDLIAESASRTS